MALQDDLYRIEEGFWLAGEEHFLANLDDRCLLAFPQMGEMHGIRSREEVAATARSPNRWRDLRLANQHILQLTDDVAIISYRADVERADGQPYSALIGSTYIRRPDGWKLAFHQHSPVE